MLKVAVIGLGNIGRTHARHYKSHDAAELVAVCDIKTERADAAAEQFNVKQYYSFEELLAREEIDAVSICTAGVENGGDHFVPAMQALEAGKHVLCEKPISNNVEHARLMVAKAKEKNLLLGINLNHRFTHMAQRLKDLQNAGDLGDLLFINMALWINNPNETSPWFHIRALHPHSIDVMRFFGGPITKVQCFMHRAPNRICWSNLSMNLQFASGAVGHLTGSYDASQNHPIERCEVMGTKGRAVIENLFQRLEWMPRTEAGKTVWENNIMTGMGSFDETFKNRIYKFIEEVNAGGPLDASGEQGLAAQEIIEAAIRSFENGSVEDVNG